MMKFLPYLIPVLFYWQYALVGPGVVIHSSENPIKYLQVVEPLGLPAACGTCPQFVGIQSDPCHGGTTEEENEYAIIISGPGFSVNDLVLDLDMSNNTGGGNNGDPGAGSCTFVTPDPALIADLQSTAPCVMAAESGDEIPCCAIVIIFTDANATSVSYDFSYICGLGFDIYVLQSGCDRSANFGAFTNGGGSGTRTYIIDVGVCLDTITYDLGLTAGADPATGNVIIDEYGVDHLTVNSCQPDLPALNFPTPLTLMGSVTDETCPGDLDGAIDITVTGGLAPYCFDWAHLSESCPGTEDLSGITGGTYYLTVTDDNGCEVMDSFVVDPPVWFYVIQSSAVACQGDSTGTVFLDSLIGGTMPYEYDWDYLEEPGNEVFDDNPMDGNEDDFLINLPAGTYGFTITDANGCMVIDSVEISEDASDLQVQLQSSLDLPCYGDTTTIDIDIGMVLYPPVTYDWDAIPGSNDPQDLTGVGAGTYMVTIMDAIGCSQIDTFTIAEPDSLSVSTSSMDPMCSGSGDGSYTITVTGGTPTYDYNDGTHSGTMQNSPITIDPATPGNYVVTITDANGCTGTASVSVTEPQPIDIQLLSSGVSCAGDSTGAIFILTLTGGTPTDTTFDFFGDTIFVYDYDWDYDDEAGNQVFDTNPPDGFEDRDITGLTAGSYSLTVTDANGCTAVATEIVFENASDLEVQLQSNLDLPCGGTTTTIDIDIGIVLFPPVTYDWDVLPGNDDPQDLVNVGPGTYIVTVMDAIGCSQMDTFVVTAPPELMLSAQGDSLSCGGMGDGSYTITVTGGTPSFSFNDGTNNGSNLGSPITVTDLPAGNYTVTVTDANGCTDEVMVSVDQPDTLEAQAYAGMIDCYGSVTDVWVEVVGGAPPFCLNWNAVSGANCAMDISEPDTLFNMGTGTYSVTVTDDNNCITVTQVTVPEPPELTGTLDTTFCEGESLMLFGETYTMPGTFMDTVIAANGCDSILTINITQDPITMITIDTSHCEGDSVFLFGSWYTGPQNNLMDTLQGQNMECDTILTINISVDPFVMIMVNENHCPGDSVLIYGEWYTGPLNNEMDTLPGQMGECDTVVTINVMVDAYEMLTVNENHCPGDSVQIYGEWYIGPVSGVQDTINGTTGCDTIVTINVMVDAYEMLTVNENHCPGDSVLIYGEWYIGPVSGVQDTINGTTGCDTIVTINVMVDAYEMLTVNENHCPGDSVQIYGEWYIGPVSGAMDTIPSPGGCDTVVTINVTVDPYETNTINASFCAGDSVQVYGEWYSAANTYMDTIAAVSGCDTVVTINITEDPLEMITVNESHCPGDSVLIYGEWYVGPVSGALDTIPAVSGCDTIVTINVTVEAFETLTVDESHCPGDSVQVYGIWYVGPVSGAMDTIPGVSGCDTVVTINVTVDPYETLTVNESHCPGDSVQVYGIWYTGPVSGAMDTIPGVSGCDTVVTINVTVEAFETLTVDESHCPGDSVQVYGIWYVGPVSGAMDTIPAVSGCDTVVTINVTVEAYEMLTVNESHCPGDSVEIYGEWYTGPVSEMDTIPGSAGCDTIVTINVTVDPYETNTINLSYCAGDSVQYNGEWYDMPGTFMDTIAAVSGCDTVATINITEDPLETLTVNESHCPGDSVLIYGEWYIGPVSATDTIPAVSGCDTIVTINVTVDPYETLTVNESHCPGDSVQVYSEWYTGPSTFTDTIPAVSGCDTIVTINVTVDPYETSTVGASYCVGDSVQVNGIWYSSPGTFMDTIPAVTGCDTVVTINITEDPLETNTIDISHCPGDSVQVNGEWYIGPASFTDTIPAVSGCDTVLTINVTVDPYETNTVDLSYCTGDSVQYNGTWYDMPGTFMDTIPAVSGCDTIVTINIAEDPLETNTVDVSHCPGDSVQVYGEWYIGPGSFTDTIAAVSGCDTVVTINVTVDPYETSTVDLSYCTGDSVQYNGNWYAMPGTFMDTIAAVSGCDTVVTINVSEDSYEQLTVDLSHCPGDSVQYGGAWYMGPGSFMDTIPAVVGCDTVVTINVTVDPYETSTVDLSYCTGDSVQYNGTWYDMPGTFMDTIAAVSGCDTVVTINISEDAYEQLTVDLSHCPGDSVQYGGTWYIGPGSFMDTIPAVVGCDTVVTINVTVDPYETNTVDLSYCTGDSVQYNGTWYDMPGTFMDTIAAVSGCDTVVTINISEDAYEQLTVDLSHCPGDSVQYGGTWYMGPGSFMDTIPAVVGCDTVVTINVTVDPYETNTVDLSYCTGDSVQYNGTWYDMPGTFMDTIAAVSGCDTVVTINVSEDSYEQLTVDLSHCPGDSVQYGGTWYMGPGSFMDTIPAVVGCDTVVTINVTVDPYETSTVDLSYCPGDSVQYNGTWYDMPGTFMDTIAAVSGCDTVVTINVSEDSYEQLTVDLSHCPGDSVQYGGTWYMGPGSFMDTIPAVVGCDTVVTINVTVDPYETNTVDLSYCTGDSVQYNGTWYDMPGTFMDTIAAVSGCDTVVTINVSEDSYEQLTVDLSHCPGDSVQYGGTWYMGPGTFTDTIPAVSGCDTVVTVNITVDPYETNTIDLFFCSGDSVEYNGTWYAMPGSFMDTVAAVTGCDTVVTINVSEDSFEQLTVDLSHCLGDSVQYGGGWYMGPGTFMDTLPAAQGCDTLLTVNVTVDPYNTEDVAATICEGDSVLIHGEWYDTEGTFTDTIAAVSGCDTIVTIIITEDPSPIVVIDPAGPYCADAGVQTLAASPGGGTWSGDVTNDQFDPAALGAGIHQVIYTVSLGSCGDADTILVEVFEEVMISCAEVTAESAPGAGDGVGSVTISSGTPLYLLEWSGPVSGSQGIGLDGTYQIPDLTGGDYTIIVTDANGCADTCMFMITTEIGCMLVIDSVQVTDAGCPGSADGMVVIFASGGVAPVMYSSDGSTFQVSNTFPTLLAGSYVFTVEDAAGCTATIPVDIGSGDGPELSLELVSPASCGFDNGSIGADATGGTPPYDYSIDGINYQPLGTFNGLAAGSYTIYLLDDSGCADTITADVPAAAAPVIDNVVIVQPTCEMANGSIMIMASGDAQPFMYSIGSGFQASNFFSNLPAGSYTVEVQDTNDCIVTQDVQLVNSGGATIDNTIVTPASCGANDGSIEVIASGGTPPYQYRIDMIDPWTNNPVFTGLSAGNHLVEVRDGSGCITSLNVNVPTTDGPEILDVNVVNTTCGEDDGEISVNATGGSGQLTYCIDPPVLSCQSDDGEFSPLPAGTYTVTVEDENGCTAEEINIIVGDSEGPTVDVIQTDEHCDQGDGWIIIFGIGGTEPHMYSFNGRPYSFNDTYFNISSEFYEICVKDANGCEDCREIFIDNDDPPVIDSVLTTPSKCSENTGTITIFAHSFADLEYSIDCINYQDSPVFTDVAPGDYTICVQDNFDCVTSTVITVGPTTTPVIDAVDVTNAECTAPGSISVTSSGGTGAHLYSIDSVNFQSSGLFTGLGAGDYTIYVIDSLECLDMVNATIDGVVPDMTSLSEMLCEGDSIVVGSETFDSTGIYQVIFTGSDGCDSIVTLNLLVEPCCTPSVDSFDAVVCQGDCYPLNGNDYCDEGIFTDTIPGGAANGCDSILVLTLGVIEAVETLENAAICEGDTISWNGMDIWVEGVYTDTLTSQLTLCDSIITLDLTVDFPPDVDSGPDKTLTCSELIVTLEGSGTGTPQWSGPGVTDPDSWQTDVTTPGVYYLTAVSPEGCQRTDSVEVFVDPNFPVADAGPDLYINCEDTVVVLQGNATPAGVLLTWTGPGIIPGQEHNASQTVTMDGVYILIAEDTVNNCVSPADTVIVTDIRVDLLANIDASGDIDCNNSEVTLFSTGSSSGPGIIYVWLDPMDMITINVSSIVADKPGMYFVFALDTLSMCQAVDSHEVLNLIEFPPADAGPDTILDCNIGFVDLTANVGNQNPDLSYQWSGPGGGIITDSSEQTIVIVEAGLYTVTVTDESNGCTSVDQVLVEDGRIEPTAEAGPSQFLDCEDDSAVLDGSQSSQGDEYEYVWNGPGIQDVQGITIEVSTPGWYHLLVKNLDNGCEDEDSTQVQVSEFLSGAVIDIVEPLCLGDESARITILQTIGGVPPYQYSLDGILFQSSPVFDSLPAGTYSLVIVDAVNCEWETTVVIDDGPELILNIGPDLELEFGETWNLFANILPPGILDSISWTPPDALSCTSCLDPVLTAIFQNDFTVTATAYAGNCIAYDELLVIVDSDFEIFVPNVFTPNHDFRNDFVTAFGGDAIRRIIEFEIFDRWGELVFRAGDIPLNVPELGWDGTFKGREMNPGVFVYKLRVELIDGSERIQSGDITLIR